MVGCTIEEFKVRDYQQRQTSSALAENRTLTLVALPTVQAAETMLTLACQGTEND
jgi:hypothetical protein